MTTDYAKLPKLRPVTAGFRPDSDVPVIPLRIEAENQGSAAPHAHPRGQVIYTTQGVLRAITPAGTWIVPHGQLLWIPPHLPHDVVFLGRVVLYSLFIAESACAAFPPHCAVLHSSPLLTQLVLSALRFGDDYPPDGPAARYMQVLQDELLRVPRADLHLPSAQDARLLHAMADLAAKPRAQVDFVALAASAATSPRTLARLFVRETGLTYGDWNRRLLVHHALQWLEKGFSVTRIALELGYQNPASFISMFRKLTGQPPGQYRQQNQHPPTAPAQD